MTTQETISKLEALLTRIRTRAAEPRITAQAAAPEALHVPIPTAPPPAEAAVALESTREPTPEVAPVEVAPVELAPVELAPVEAAPAELESRARLVAEREPEPEVLELDDRHVVTEDVEVSIVAEDIVVDEEEVREAPPPSSRRPIAEPLDAAPPEAAPIHTPPPESGQQVAALSFDDDFTGVRDAAQRPAPPPEPDAQEIHLASQHPPAMAAKHEMEAELDIAAQAPAQAAPASVRLPSERPAAALEMEPEVIRPVLAQAPVADVHGALTFAPKTFGELLDASLAL